MISNISQPEGGQKEFAASPYLHQILPELASSYSPTVGQLPEHEEGGHQNYHQGGALHCLP